MQSVRCTEMPICSCVRTRGAPSSPRTTLLTAARAYAVLHLCIPARYVAAPKPGVWCGYIKSACGSIRTNVAFACKRELGSAVVRNTHKALHHQQQQATAAPVPSTRLRDAAATAAAALRRHAGSVACVVALGIFRSPRSSFSSILVTATRKPDETLKTPTPWMTVQRMEAMRPAAQRPRQSAGPFRGLDLRLATLRLPDRLETCSFFRDKATFRSVCRCTAALCDR